MSNTEDLHGNAPDKSKVALLLIDVINDFEFEDGAKLLKMRCRWRENSPLCAREPKRKTCR